MKQPQKKEFKKMEFKRRNEELPAPMAAAFMSDSIPNSCPETTDGLQVGATVQLVTDDGKKIDVEVVEVIGTHRYKGKIASSDSDHIVEFVERHIHDYHTA